MEEAANHEIFEQERARFIQELNAIPPQTSCKLLHERPDEVGTRLIPTGRVIFKWYPECPADKRNNSIGCAHSTYLTDKLRAACRFIRTSYSDNYSEENRFSSLALEIRSLIDNIENIDNRKRALYGYIYVVNNGFDLVKNNFHNMATSIEDAEEQIIALDEQHEAIIQRLMSIRDELVTYLESMNPLQ